MSLIIACGGLYLNWVVNQPRMAIKDIYVSVNPQHTQVQFAVGSTNASSAAAKEFVSDCKAFWNGQPEGTDISIPAKPVTIGGHTEAIQCRGELAGRFAQQALDGTASFDVYVIWTYKGFFNSFSFCSKQHFVPQYARFADLADCDPTKPFPQ